MRDRIDVELKKDTDPTALLALADRCEERGDAERAWFYRVAYAVRVALDGALASPLLRLSPSDLRHLPSHARRVARTAQAPGGPEIEVELFISSKLHTGVVRFYCTLLNGAGIHLAARGGEPIGAAHLARKALEVTRRLLAAADATPPDRR